LLEKGTIVEFRLQGDSGSDGKRNCRLGLFDRTEGKKHLVVTDSAGRAHTIHPRQINYTVTGQQYEPSELGKFSDAVDQLLDPASLEIAWELLVEDQESTSPEELTLLLFSEQTPELCYASFCLLADDKLYFKQKGDRFEPRPEKQVADLKHQIQRQAERQQQEDNFYQNLAAAIEGNAIDWPPGDRLYLSAVEKYALFGDESHSRAQSCEILSHTTFDQTPAGAFQLMVALGIWDKHENLALHRNHIPLKFPDDVVRAMEHYIEVPPPDLDQKYRRDLTHLKVYTIDDESTAEIDDGLSLELLDDGRERIWVHIADPTRWVFPGDPLEQEAQRKTTTIYLPTGMIPMFPVELSTGPMSLTQGTVCCALSFGILLAEDGALESFEITTSQIKPTYRLTYDDVDEMLELGIEAEAELLKLAKYAARRRDWRQAQGSINIQMPESLIKVNEEQQVTIDILPDSMSRNLVAEMMILTGQVAANYGAGHKIPLPFRHQPQPELPTEEELLQYAPGPVRACAIRRCMTRSEVGTTPLRHAGLGIDHYCQVTSPIRRYADLLAHFQLKAYLRGDELPFDAAELNLLISMVVPVAYEATLVERQTNRYWSLEFLRQHDGEVWRALVLRWLREHENLAIVMLEDLGLELPIRFGRNVHLGESLNVVVQEVDPRLDRIFLAEYTEASKA
jgi:exoribonuclease II